MFARFPIVHAVIGKPFWVAAASEDISGDTKHILQYLLWTAIQDSLN